ncbi:MAG: hypothetical protein KatS3mg002_0231 [Candidatus Woesearchaeota archaeon]|nr:MAG: hypothetical protein KatS3mg002_0231 [Candidatus Woesearchaeota archaeon]
MRTYHGRLILSEEDSLLLDQMARLLSTVERKLYATLQSDPNPRLDVIKKQFLRTYNITARHFNSVRVALEGKMRAEKEIRTRRITELQRRIEAQERAVEKIRDPFKLHNAKRRLHRLRTQLESLRSDNKNHLCFGGRKLFRAQFHLEQNGFASHEEWKVAWDLKRNQQFWLVGSKDETGGCQSCVATQLDDTTFRLRIRLPNNFPKKYVHAEVKLPHGHQHLANALIVKQAITYRFLHDEKGWRVFVSTKPIDVEITTDRRLGAIGVDINADHLAVTELDRHGNPIRSMSIPMHLYGKSQNQRKDVIGVAVRELMKFADGLGKPIVVEKLDFTAKKASLRLETKRTKRMLSSFAYTLVLNTIKARAFDQGIEVLHVNPAFSSVIGRHKFQKRYGLTTHQAAAAVLGRRGLSFSERPNRHMEDQVAFLLPVRNRKKHVWSFWREVARNEAAHAAQCRAAARTQRSSRSSKRSPGVMEQSFRPHLSGGSPARESSVAPFDWRPPAWW